MPIECVLCVQRIRLNKCWRRAAFRSFEELRGLNVSSTEVLTQLHSVKNYYYIVHVCQCRMYRILKKNKVGDDWWQLGMVWSMIMNSWNEMHFFFFPHFRTAMSRAARLPCTSMCSIWRSAIRWSSIQMDTALRLRWTVCINLQVSEQTNHIKVKNIYWLFIAEWRLFNCGSIVERIACRGIARTPDTRRRPFSKQSGSGIIN